MKGMGLWCDVVPGDAATTIWGHGPGEESCDTDPSWAAPALPGHWVGVPVAQGGSATWGLSRHSWDTVGLCLGGPLLLLLSISVEVRGFCPWVPNAARAGSRGEL